MRFRLWSGVAARPEVFRKVAVMSLTVAKFPGVVMVMKPVDGGRATIGLIECPNCGETHYTTQIECGERNVFCGTAGDNSPAIRPDGFSTVDVERIL